MGSMSMLGTYNPTGIDLSCKAASVPKYPLVGNAEADAAEAATET